MNIFSQYTIKIKKLVNNLKNKGKIDLPSNLDSVIVDIPPKKFLGDISCNVAMIISKINKKNPIEIANLISNEIENNIIKKTIKEKYFEFIFSDLFIIL